MGAAIAAHTQKKMRTEGEHHGFLSDKKEIHQSDRNIYLGDFLSYVVGT